jgi:hypothetical protein
MQPPGVLKLDGRSFKPADSRDNPFRSIFRLPDRSAAIPGRLRGTTIYSAGTCSAGTADMT